MCCRKKKRKSDGDPPFLHLDATQFGVAICKTHVHLMGFAHDRLAALRADRVRNDPGVLAVLHEQHVEILHVVDGEVLEPAGVHVARGAVAAVPLVRHRLLPLVTPAYGRVDAAGLTPRGTDGFKKLALVTRKLRRALLHNRLSDKRLHHFSFCSSPGVLPKWIKLQV